MAGVIIASPKNSEAPARPAISAARRQRSGAEGRARDRSATEPPSPWLSALITSRTYLTPTTSSTAETIREATRSAGAAPSSAACLTALKADLGLILGLLKIAP